METISRDNIFKDTDTQWGAKKQFWFCDLLFGVPPDDLAQPSQLQLDSANRFMAFCATDDFRTRLDFWIHELFKNLSEEDFKGDSEEYSDLQKVRLPDIRVHYDFSEMLLPYEGCSSEEFYVCGIFQAAADSWEILLRVSTTAVQLVFIGSSSGLKSKAYHWCTLSAEDLQKWLKVEDRYHPPESTWMIPSTD